MFVNVTRVIVNSVITHVYILRVHMLVEDSIPVFAYMTCLLVDSV